MFHYLPLFAQANFDNAIDLVQCIFLSDEYSLCVGQFHWNIFDRKVPQEVKGKMVFLVAYDAFFSN